MIQHSDGDLHVQSMCLNILHWFLPRVAYQEWDPANLLCGIVPIFRLRLLGICGIRSLGTASILGLTCKRTMIIPLALSFFVDSFQVQHSYSKVLRVSLSESSTPLGVVHVLDQCSKPLTHHLAELLNIAHSVGVHVAAHTGHIIPDSQSNYARQSQVWYSGHVFKQEPTHSLA